MSVAIAAGDKVRLPRRRNQGSFPPSRLCPAARAAARGSHPVIRDQLSRIGIYGSSGIPKFVLPSIEEQLKRGGPIKLLSFTVASWFRYLSGLDESGKDMPILLGIREVFGEKLAGAPAFVEAISNTLNSFYQDGARATLKKSIS